MVNGILPTPWDQPSFVLRNSLGAEISLAFLPVLSVVLSLACVVANAVASANVTNVHQAASFTAFFVANVLFRLQVISTHLAGPIPFQCHSNQTRKLEIMQKYY